MLHYKFAAIIVSVKINLHICEILCVNIFQ